MTKLTKNNQGKLMDNSAKNEMQKLLDNVKKIDRGYKNASSNDDFNIFSLLRKESDEVYLHSRFIGEMLNPKGSHNQNDLFLKLFVSDLSKAIFNQTNIVIEHELLTSNARLDIELFDNTGDENNRIDLTIRTDKSIIIIENKLWAPDQPKQLTRYYEFALLSNYAPQNIHMIYLTLDGHEPSSESIKNLPREANIILFSYKRHIKLWLEHCINQTDSHEPLLHTLNQYLTLIKKLTGQSMSDKNRDDIVDLILEGNNAIYAKKIFDVWPNFQYNTICTFFYELEAKLKSEIPNFTTLDFMKYNSDDLWQIVYRNVSKFRSDGIIFKLSKYSKEIDICIFIEPSWDQLRFGVILINNANGYKIEEGTLEKNEPFTTIRNKISSMQNFQFTTQNSDQQWFAEVSTSPLGWWLVNVKIITPDIQLFKFTSADTLKLAKPAEREIFIARLVKEIKVFSQAILDLLDKPQSI